MVQSLEYRRPIVNGYSGQRPDLYPALVDALSTFPSDEALQALEDSGVQYVVAPRAVQRPDPDAPWPLEMRAQFPGAAVYELVVAAGMEARSARAAVVPPPPGRIPFVPGEQMRYTVRWDGAGVDVAAGEISVSVEPPAYTLVIKAVTAPWV